MSLHQCGHEVCLLSRCRLTDRTLPGVWIWCRPPLQPDWFRLPCLLLVSVWVFFIKTQICSLCVTFLSICPTLWWTWIWKLSWELLKCCTRDKQTCDLLWFLLALSLVVNKSFGRVSTERAERAARSRTDVSMNQWYFMWSPPTQKQTWSLLLCPTADFVILGLIFLSD